MTAKRIVLGTVVVAGAILLGLRQRTLAELRASNEALRQEAAAAGADPEMASPALDANPTNGPGPLTSKEQTELLRLRGEVVLLRRELQSVNSQR